MIRPAKVADIPTIIALGKVMAAESPTYAAVPWNDGKATAFLTDILTSGDGVIFLYEREGEVLGGFGGGMTDHWFSDEKYAFDFFLFVVPSARSGSIAVRLVATFEAWAKSQGAKAVQCGITTGVRVESTTKLYEAMGYRCLGPLLTKDI